jgi:hypothetical protein
LAFDCPGPGTTENDVPKVGRSGSDRVTKNQLNVARKIRRTS